MNVLPTKENKTLVIEPTQEILCSNEVSVVLSKNTLDALEELGDVLKGIRKRMIFEGYEIVGGSIRKVVPKM